jgi:hypothetical protein
MQVALKGNDALRLVDAMNRPRHVNCAIIRRVGVAFGQMLPENTPHSSGFLAPFPSPAPEKRE